MINVHPRYDGGGKISLFPLFHMYPCQFHFSPISLDVVILSQVFPYILPWRVPEPGCLDTKENTHCVGEEVRSELSAWQMLQFYLSRHEKRRGHADTVRGNFDGLWKGAVL